MPNRDELIAQLSQNLQARPPRISNIQLAILWWVLSWAYVIGITLLMGPLRPAAMIQLLESPHFLLESLLGLAASLAITLTAWASAIPGALTRRQLYFSIFLAVFWLSSYLVGFLHPAVEPTMAGKREHCYIETLLYTVPPSVIACVMAWRLMPLKPLQTGLMIGLASGMIPALLMQFACMYGPFHILERHILPGAVSAIIPISIFALAPKK